MNNRRGKLVITIYC